MSGKGLLVFVSSILLFSGRSSNFIDFYLVACNKGMFTCFFLVGLQCHEVVNCRTSVRNAVDHYHHSSLYLSLYIIIL